MKIPQTVFKTVRKNPIGIKIKQHFRNMTKANETFGDRTQAEELDGASENSLLLPVTYTHVVTVWADVECRTRS